MRWNSILNISPAEFIPIAIEKNLIGKIGERIIRQATSVLPKWNKIFPDFNLSINIAAAQLNNELPHLLQKYITTNRCDPQNLELEITENDILPLEHEHVLNQIIAKQINLSIDDFGKEYSSLARIGELPVKTVKIDMSFTHALKEIDGEIIKDKICLNLLSIIGYLHNMNFKIVVEGVETLAQFNLIKNYLNEHDVIQGYFMPGQENNQPKSLQDFNKLLSTFI